MAPDNAEKRYKRNRSIRNNAIYRNRDIAVVENSRPRASLLYVWPDLTTIIIIPTLMIEHGDRDLHVMVMGGRILSGRPI